MQNSHQLRNYLPSQYFIQWLWKKGSNFHQGPIFTRHGTGHNPTGRSERADPLTLKTGPRIQYHGRRKKNTQHPTLITAAAFITHHNTVLAKPENLNAASELNSPKHSCIHSISFPGLCSIKYLKIWKFKYSALLRNNTMGLPAKGPRAAGAVQTSIRKKLCACYSAENFKCLGCFFFSPQGLNMKWQKDSAKGRMEIVFWSWVRMTEGFIWPSLFSLSLPFVKRTMIPSETWANYKGLCHRTNGDSTKS